MTTPNNLDPLREAILELSGAHAYLTGISEYSTIGKLHLALSDTLTASADKGETDPNQLAARITDILRETEQRLGIKLTGEQK